MWCKYYNCNIFFLKKKKGKKKYSHSATWTTPNAQRNNTLTPHAQRVNINASFHFKASSPLHRTTLKKKAPISSLSLSAFRNSLFQLHSERRRLQQVKKKKKHKKYLSLSDSISNLFRSDIYLYTCMYFAMFDSVFFC